MNMRTLIGAAAVATLPAVAVSASTLSGVATGTFDATTLVGSGVVSVSAPNQLEWGTATSSGSDTTPVNSLQVNAGFGDTLVTSPTQVDLLSIDWQNQSSFNSSSDISVELDVLLDFSSPADLLPIPEMFSVLIQQTADPSNTVTNNNTGLDPDNTFGLVVSSLGFGAPLVVGDLVISSFEFVLTDDGQATGSVNPGSTYNSTSGLWTLREGGSATLTLVANVGPSEIPLPAGAWLLIGGLGGLAALRRRKKA